MVISMLITVLLSTALSLAQDNTISLYIPGANIQALVGSIVASDESATTYALQCAPGTDSDDCGFPGVFTLTEGPSTAFYTLSGDVEDSGGSTVLAFTAKFNCTLTTSTAICSESFGGRQANFPGTTTETFTGTDFFWMPAVITATATPTSTPTSSDASSITDGMVSATDSSSGSTTSGSGSNSGVSVTSSETVASSARPASTSTGGMPVVTGRVWAVGGVAVVAALL